jgi:hypothetical protein
MLHEITVARKDDSGYQRHWYEDERMDLFVWYDEAGEFVSFQLAYDKPFAERAIAWKRERGFMHARVDDGARGGRHPGSPLLVGEGEIQVGPVIDEFRQRATNVDATVANFVLEKLEQFPRQSGVPRWRRVAKGRMEPLRPTHLDGRAIAASLVVIALLLLWGISK